MKDLHITHPNEEQTKEQLGLEGYNFMGWENGWGEMNKPNGFLKCKKAEHSLKSKQHNNRGSNNTVWCEECKIFWKYDCSD